MYHYVPIVARMRKRVISSKHVHHVRWLNIAIENVKLHTDHNIKKNVENELPSYTI